MIEITYPPQQGYDLVQRWEITELGRRALGRPCPKCSGRGWNGRLGVFAVIEDRCQFCDGTGRIPLDAHDGGGA